MKPLMSLRLGSWTSASGMQSSTYKIEKLKHDRATDTIKDDKGTRVDGLLCDKVGQDKQERDTRPYRYTSTIGRSVY